MSKAWEETWRAVENGAHSFVVFGRGDAMVKYDPANYTQEEAFAKAQLMSAAPEMTRALLEVEWSGTDEFCSGHTNETALGCTGHCPACGSDHGSAHAPGLRARRRAPKGWCAVSKARLRECLV